MKANSRRPLQGKCILVTRARSQAGELKEKIKEYGGIPLEFPVIQVVPPKNKKPLDEAIRNLEQFQWILFTSTNGVKFFFQRMEEINESLAAMKSRIAAVGPKTAEALQSKGLRVDFIAKEYKAEGLLQILKGHLQKGDRILLPRANIARSTLPKELTSMGMLVTEIDVYDTVMVTEGVGEIVEKFKGGLIDAVTFTSSSTVKNFYEALSNHINVRDCLSGVRVACIGPVTAETAAGLGLKVDTVAEEYTIDGLVKALVRSFEEESR